MRNVLIIEDIYETSQWLADVVKKAFPTTNLTLCSSIKSTTEVLNQCSPDLALVDIKLPDGEGLTLIPKILQVSPDAIIVVTTILDDQEHIFEALQQGAQGYLLKDLAENVFIQKLQGILQGDPPLSPRIARKILNYCSNQSALTSSIKSASENQQLLSSREVDILVLIAKGFSRREVSHLFNISDNTVATHVKKIYQKLHINNRAEAVSEAYRLGLVRMD